MEENHKISLAGIKEMMNKFQEKPSLLWMLLGLTGLGLVLLLSGGNGRNIPNNLQQPTNLTTVQDFVDKKSVSEEERLERELTLTLKRIAGAGQVRVDLNLKSGNRRIWERQARVNKRVIQEQGSLNTEESTSDELVFAKDRDGRDTPILKEELAAEIQGVIVVAGGAGDSRVKQLLTDTVITILGLPEHRIMVIAGENEGEDPK